MIIDDPGQDRLVNELYAWIAIDPRTGLEGICGFTVHGRSMQAVTASKATAEKMEPIISNIAKTLTSKKFKLIRFDKPHVIKQL